MRAASKPWIVSLSTSSSAPARVLLLPAAGAGVSRLVPLARAMPGLDVYGASLPGHEGRYDEAPERDLATIVDRLVDALCREPGPPWALVGHSFGALLAYETARRLKDDGRSTVTAVVVAAADPPHVARRVAPIAQLDEDAFLRRVVALGGMPEALLHDDGLRPLIAPGLRADFSIVERYTPCADPVEAPLLVLGGDDDPSVSGSELQAWRALRADAPVEMSTGDHFFVWAAASTLGPRIARFIRASLA